MGKLFHMKGPGFNLLLCHIRRSLSHVGWFEATPLPLPKEDFLSHRGVDYCATVPGTDRVVEHLCKNYLAF